MSNDEIDARLAEIDRLAREIADVCPKDGERQFFCFAGRTFGPEARTLDVAACSENFMSQALIKHLNLIHEHHKKPEPRYTQ